MPAKEAPRISWLVHPTFDQDGVQATAGLDQFSREHGDPVPMAPPIGLEAPKTDDLHTAIRNIMIRERNIFQAAVEAEQFESEEEANDFLTEDDVFPPGNEPWEDIFEFPAEASGAAANGPTLASGAVKGEAAQTAPPAVASQRASSGSLPELKTTEKTAEKPSGWPPDALGGDVTPGTRVGNSRS